MGVPRTPGSPVSLGSASYIRPLAGQDRHGWLACSPWSMPGVWMGEEGAEDGQDPLSLGVPPLRSPRVGSAWPHVIVTLGRSDVGPGAGRGALRRCAVGTPQ